jgi:hypothetical protein
MNLTPAKRARRSLSPATSSHSLPPSSRAGLIASPSHSILPAPFPSPVVLQPHPQPHIHFQPPLASPSAGPSDWQSTGGWSGQLRTGRRSIDAGASVRSTGTVDSEDAGEGEDEFGAGNAVFARDVSGRAPRSMMACKRCRRQK